MVTLYFECKLLSDIVMTQKSASEGHHRTLDFIPGSNFLGIVAQQVYQDSHVDAAVKTSLFHNGDVRYGDAHPSADGHRAVRTPASVFYPKLSKVSDEAYVHYLIPGLHSEEMKQKQLKQCRSGFYIMDSTCARSVETFTRFSIKSAYDKDKRGAEDEKMYGYQALAKGLTFYFQVDARNEKLADIVKNSLTGIKNIGRSRSAEYGLVQITPLEKAYAQPESTEELTIINNAKYAIVYAESRLIFFDETGMPTLQPTPQQLGVSDGIQVDMSKSQIRSFHYAPYNSQRRQFDSDRYGIEKGSVFVVRTDSFSMPTDPVVGFYKNEGFGKVIFNPDFLKTDANGKCKIIFSDTTDQEKAAKALMDFASPDPKPLDETLLGFLRKKKESTKATNNKYISVNAFVQNNLALFADESFAAQWGTIRNEALRIQKDDTIDHKTENLKSILFHAANGYLTSGVAAAKWDEKNRILLLKKFISEQEELYKNQTDWNAKVLDAIINLASQMAKSRR